MRLKWADRVTGSKPLTALEKLLAVSSERAPIRTEKAKTDGPDARGRNTGLNWPREAAVGALVEARQGKTVVPEARSNPASFHQRETAHILIVRS